MIELPDRLHGTIFLDTETKDDGLQNEKGPGWAFPNSGRIAGVSIKADNFFDYIPIGHATGNNEDPERVRSWLRHVLSEESQLKVMANAPYDIGWLRREGVLVKGRVEDVLVQGALCDENLFKYSLENLCKHFAGIDNAKYEEELVAACAKYGFKITKKNPVQSHIWKLSGEETRVYAKRDVESTEILWKKTSKIIVDEELEQVHDLETELIPLLIEMRWRGVRVDLDQAEALREEFNGKRDEALYKIKKKTGVDVSPTDDKSLAKALAVEGIVVPISQKIKKPEINSKHLLTLNNEVANAVVDCRKYEHASNTFVQGMVFDHHHNGRVHSTLNSVKGERGGTVSGRFSSTDPNLQQIPKRDEDIGPKIRQMFLPEEGEEMCDIDYSAQEPRWTAEFALRAKVAGGERVAQQYIDNPKTDYHQFTADLAGITRKEAKPINLGLAYGMGEAKLCHSLGLPTVFIFKWGKEIEVAGPEGKELLKRYHAGVPFIKPLMKMCADQANKKGFVKTILGRRCRFRVYEGRLMDTHKALNRVIQGSSADQTKMAMLKMWKHGVVPLLSIHDELIFSVKKREEAALLSNIMQTAIPSSVPFIGEPEFGPNLGECK